MKQLVDNLAVLSGLGPKSAEKFSLLNIESVGDLLEYFPFRFEDFRQQSALDLVDGEKAVVVGTVVSPPTVSYFGYKRNRLRFSIRQGELVISVSFFNQAYLSDKVKPGEDVAVWGKWDQKKGSLSGLKLLGSSSQELEPVYHVVSGISQSLLKKAIRSAFDQGYVDLVLENLPQELLDRYRLLGRKEAVCAMHYPQDLASYKAAVRRLKFEELLLFQLQLQDLKMKLSSVGEGQALPIDDKRLSQARDSLPFQLTPPQERALQEILSDMSSNHHMNRLLQGDVGSGKTVVAGLAMVAAVSAGFQAALMVPTEILAEQHYENLHDLFPDLSMALLTGGMKSAPRKTALEAIRTGGVDIVIGTHALIQESVEYHRLGLVITDEQHRFGVEQRRRLREKGDNPDVLMMTATPIPRTLAITAFGDMDVSIIDQLPAGRKPIQTRWVKHEQIPAVLDWLRQQVSRGEQVYVVSPLIEESEALDLKNAIALEEELSSYLQDVGRVALLHGRMKNEEKEAIMSDFKSGRVQVLVSTTVIEVGVNVPNATIMVIMDADRFGLSQLHQLRGRVGRGSKQSYAILVANPKTDSGKQRMQAMVSTRDGFVLAEEDLKMRGSGEIFGTRQSGLPEFQLANLIEDYPILEEARKVAIQIASDPNWKENPSYKGLVQKLASSHSLD